MKTALLCAATLVAGIVIARVIMPAPSHAPAPRVASERGEVVSEARDYRAAPLDGVAAPGRYAAPVAPRADDVVAAPAPSPEAMNAAADAHDLVDRAISRGEWTEDDALQLRALTGQLTGDDMAIILGKLAAAINAQQLAPTSARFL